MKEVVMCNKNLRLKSPLRVNRQLEFTEHRNFDFALCRGRGGGGGGVTLILNMIFSTGRVTKILNFGLKIKGVVGRVAHAKSSDPTTPTPTPKKSLKRALARQGGLSVVEQFALGLCEQALITRLNVAQSLGPASKWFFIILGVFANI